MDMLNDILTCLKSSHQFIDQLINPFLDIKLVNKINEKDLADFLTKISDLIENMCRVNETYRDTISNFGII